MELNNIEKYLERIAIALEKISDKIDINPNDNVNRNLVNGGIDSKRVSNEEETFVEATHKNDNSEIIEFLSSKNISVKTVKPEDEADDVLDNISLFMGERYSKIKRVYDLIKRNMNSGGSFRLDLKNLQQDEISSITQLCTNLHQIAFLEEYKYYKSPRFLLYGKVNRIPNALNFFSGGWLERYIKTVIIKTIDKCLLSYSYLKNPQIELPNGDDFELDILFKIEDEIFWIEAKTGDYQRYVQKYSNVAKLLNLDYEHSFMVLSDIHTGAASALKSLFNMTIYRIDDFSVEFKENIAHLFNDPILNDEITTPQQKI